MRLLQQTGDHLLRTAPNLRRTTEIEPRLLPVLALLVFFQHDEAEHSEDSSSDDGHHHGDDDVVGILFT